MNTYAWDEEAQQRRPVNAPAKAEVEAAILNAVLTQDYIAGDVRPEYLMPLNSVSRKLRDGFSHILTAQQRAEVIANPEYYPALYCDVQNSNSKPATRRESPETSELSNKTAELMASRYENGFTLTEIAEAFSLSVYSVRKSLLELGVELRKRGGYVRVN